MTKQNENPAGHPLLVEGERRAGKTIPPGDGLHAAVAALEDLTVATADVGHFKALGVRAVNPFK